MASFQKPAGRSRWIVLVISILVIGFFIKDTLDNNGELPDFFQDVPSSTSQQVVSSPEDIPIYVQTDGMLQVHFIDVGQGESIYIQGEQVNVLMDGGEVGSENIVIPYLEQLGVEKIDYIIATHPHSDHIGGLPSVIETFEIGEVIMPELPDDLIPTTRVFTKLLQAIQSQGLQITASEVGAEYSLGGGATLTILGPTEDYDDLNDYSIVARLDDGEVSFLFTGDAEKTAEQDLIDAGTNLNATVLSAGHHGSSTSTGEEFLSLVSPDIVVISCGLDNSYGHPHRETLAALNAIDCSVYRTDLDGTVVLESDGQNIVVQAERLVSVVE